MVWQHHHTCSQDIGQVLFRDTTWRFLLWRSLAWWCKAYQSQVTAFKWLWKTNRSLFLSFWALEFWRNLFGCLPWTTEASHRTKTAARSKSKPNFMYIIYLHLGSKFDTGVCCKKPKLSPKRHWGTRSTNLPGRVWFLLLSKVSRTLILNKFSEVANTSYGPS